MTEHIELGSISKTHRIGLISIGLNTYWEQYTGLLERLLRVNDDISSRIKAFGTDVINTGMVDTPEKAIAAGHALRQADVDLILVHVATYALSAAILPVLRRCRIPVVVLDLSPTSRIDYEQFNKLPTRTEMTGTWLAYCQSCSIPELANVCKRSGVPFNYVRGVLNDDETWREIQEWVVASRVAHAMAHNRLGVLGHYYSGMLDIYSDLTLQSAVFGTDIVILEVDELSALRQNVSRAAIDCRLREMLTTFDVQPDCSANELESAARTSLALDEFVQKYHLGSMAFYYKGTGVPANEETLSSIIVGTSLLTGRGVPVAGELEIKNAQAMKILDLLGVGGSFTEHYANDFVDDVILMGHDGPGHIAIAEGKAKLRPLKEYHGKVGSGLSIEMSVKHGPVTLLAVAEDGRGGLQFVVAEAESVAGPILEIGNTNSRYRFPIGARAFARAWNESGVAHHWAIGLGHQASIVRKLATILGIECVQVC